MATYKVIQDIEAEDHILGPLTLRQFIYGLSTIFFLYLSFLALTKHALFMLIVLLPPGLLSGFFAFPFRRDQPTEVWALARLRFLFKPRKRLWNQSGVKELVTITAPKKTEKPLTNGLSQAEVRNRLQALTLMIDSRGWAIKNMASVPDDSRVIEPDNSDRLIDIGSMPKPVPDYDITPADDILDEQNNPLAQAMNNRINLSAQAHRQRIIDSLNNRGPLTVDQPVLDTTDENVLSAELKARNSFVNPQVPITHMAPSVATHSNYPMTQPSPTQPANPAPLSHPVVPQYSAPQPQQGQTAYPELLTPAVDNTKYQEPVNTTNENQKPNPVDPVILNLANNSYLSVATLDHEAQKSMPDDEVVINLH